MISIIITAVFYAFFASVILFGLYLLAVGPRDVIGLMTGDIYTRNPIITGSKALQNGDRLTVETETKGE